MPGSAENISPTSTKKLRVAVCQPSLPHYRVPFFRKLAAHRDIQSVTVFCDRNREGMHSGEGGDVTVVEGDIVRHSFPPGVMTQTAMLQALNSTQFDVAVMSWNVRYLTLPRAIVRARRRGVPVLLWGHGSSKNPKLTTDLVRRTYGKFANGVILYDHSAADNLKTARGFTEQNVFIAQNALDQTPILAARKEWTCEDQKLKAFRKQHQLDPSKTFLLVSRLLPENRAELLIEMMSHLQKESADAKLVIVGDGPDRARLERIVSNYEIEGSVIFTGAIYDEPELAPWMLSSTALVYPGNMGLSLLHAFGYGLPVITGDRKQGHGPEIHALRDGENGLFFRDGDVHALLAQCRRVIASPEFNERLSRAALETVATDYTIDRMVSGFAHGLTSVTGTMQKNELQRAA